jgi:phosphoribosylamine--glycine ligase
MNIAIVSSTSSYHHLAQLFLKRSNTDQVYHYGANFSVKETDQYQTLPIEIPILPKNFNIDEELKIVVNDIKNRNINFVLTSSLQVPSSRYFHDALSNLNVPYFFVSPELTSLEKNKSLCKKMLTHLGIPTSIGETVDGKYLFENFYKIERPFVVKLNFVYQYGKQTIIVDDENYEEVYMDLFSVRLNQNARITNINFDTSLIIEKFIRLKREYSYHCLMNNENWRYFGSARDYKKTEDGDKGFNSVSMGAYNTNDIDPIVHEYADKIFNFLKQRGTPYKGFMFIGIGVDENDVPIVLEINTRSGDPELQVIVNSIKNDLGDLFYRASKDLPIPEIIHDDQKTVTVRLINSVYDWTKKSSFLPKLAPCPDHIIQGIEGTNGFYLKHSVFTCSSNSHHESATSIYDYLDKQFVGQFRYRRDIGFLK